MHHLQAVYKLIMHISIPPTFLREKDAVWPPRTSLTGILLRWMDLTAMGVKVPSGSGPNSRVSLSRINPRNVVPDTTVPTPCQENTQTVLIYEHSIHFVYSVQHVLENNQSAAQQIKKTVTAVTQVAEHFQGMLLLRNTPNLQQLTLSNCCHLFTQGSTSHSAYCQLSCLVQSTLICSKSKARKAFKKKKEKGKSQECVCVCFAPVLSKCRLFGTQQARHY